MLSFHANLFAEPTQHAAGPLVSLRGLALATLVAPGGDPPLLVETFGVTFEQARDRLFGEFGDRHDALSPKDAIRTDRCRKRPVPVRTGPRRSRGMTGFVVRSRFAERDEKFDLACFERGIDSHIRLLAALAGG